MRNFISNKQESGTTPTSKINRNKSNENINQNICKNRSASNKNASRAKF